LVHASLEVLARQQDLFYAQIWNSLTSIQQRTLKALIREKGANMQTNRVVNCIGNSAPAVRQALISMSTQTILRDEQTRNQKVYRFEDPFFASWIRLTTGR
jgi:hypothetical protein